jgi:hypothetical protein
LLPLLLLLLQLLLLRDCCATAARRLLLLLRLMMSVARSKKARRLEGRRCAAGSPRCRRRLEQDEVELLGAMELCVADAHDRRDRQQLVSVPRSSAPLFKTKQSLV